MSLQWIDVSFFVAGKSSHGALFTRPGKHTKTYKDYGTLQFFMAKSIISMAIFNIYVSLPEGKCFYIPQIVKRGRVKTYKL